MGYAKGESRASLRVHRHPYHISHGVAGAWYAGNELYAGFVVAHVPAVVVEAFAGSVDHLDRVCAEIAGMLPHSLIGLAPTVAVNLVDWVRRHCA